MSSSNNSEEETRSLGIEESPTVETISFLDSPSSSTLQPPNKNPNPDDILIDHDDNTNNNDTNSNDLSQPLLPNLNTYNEEVDTNNNVNCTSKLTSCFKSIFKIYTNQSPSCLTLTKGLSIAALSGIILGIIIPKNPNLPSPFYQYISSILGYTYFVAWSISFYPQIITNYKRKKIDGLSVDASILAVLNYTCYTIYTTFFFWDGTIRQEYKDRNGDNSEVTVMSNDVAFALNSLLLTSITLFQVFYYGGFEDQPMSKICGGIVWMTFGVSFAYIWCILWEVPGFLWIDFLYLMGTVKLILTIMTYVPQIFLNFKRRSTEGFNIWNVIFDCSGGVLSLLQLVFDCLDMNDFSGILGNWAKFVLSLITLVFDGILFLQHYVLFRDNNRGTNSESSSSPNYILSENEALYTPMIDTDENGEEILTEIV